MASRWEPYINRVPLKMNFGQVPVVHTCNPNYSGGRAQENQVQSLPRQILLEIYLGKKKTHNKKGLVESLNV
jgi:hypothetical protein